MAKTTQKGLSEWQALIKAQDDTSMLLIKQEKEREKLNKIMYKEELDRQLMEKYKNNDKGQTDEIGFVKAQQDAIVKFEANKKKENLLYQKIFYVANQGEEKFKNKKNLVEAQLERDLERQRLQKLKETVDKEKREQQEFKLKKYFEQKKILESQIDEKNKKDELERRQKDLDKAMIKKTMQEMLVKEQSYKNFYDKRLESLDKKVKNFHPAFEKDNYRKELIRKRNEEWEKMNQEKQEKIEIFEEKAKKRAIHELRLELEKQIDYKQQKRLEEWQESLKDQEIARMKAKEAEVLKHKEETSKKIQMASLKNYLEKQLDERNSGLSEVSMDPVEKQLNKKFLDLVSHHKTLSFQGIPGVQSSPLRLPAQKLNSYSNTPDPKEVPTTDYGFPISISNSFAGKLKKPALDIYKHDPIINPIGSSIPRVLPGQRIVRGIQSNSTFINAASHLFK